MDGGHGLVAKSCPTIARQALLSIGFSRQEYWSGLPFPSPGDLPNPRIEPRCPALQADSLPTELQGKPLVGYYQLKNCLEPEVRTKHKNLEVTNFLSPTLSFLSGFQSVDPTVGQEEALSTTLGAPLSCWWGGPGVRIPGQSSLFESQHASWPLGIIQDEGSCQTRSPSALP